MPNSVVYNLVAFANVDFQCLTNDTIAQQSVILNFFSTLAKKYIDESYTNARIDFLACNTGPSENGPSIAREIENITAVSRAAVDYVFLTSRIA